MDNSYIELTELIKIRQQLKSEGKKVVFTNGCFDIIHAGHVDYMNKAKAAGDILIVGLNSDSSINRIKGENRPIVNQEQRAIVISNLKAVDYVTIFDEDTPEELINSLIPDYLVKGADWPMEQIIGRDVVVNNGGEVKRIQFVNDQSTSKIIEKIIKVYS